MEDIHEEEGEEHGECIEDVDKVLVVVDVHVGGGALARGKLDDAIHDSVLGREGQ